MYRVTPTLGPCRSTLHVYISHLNILQSTKQCCKMELDGMAAAFLTHLLEKLRTTRRSVYNFNAYGNFNWLSSLGMCNKKMCGSAARNELFFHRWHSIVFITYVWYLYVYAYIYKFLLRGVAMQHLEILLKKKLIPLARETKEGPRCVGR